MRLETPADRAAVRRIHEAAFGRVDEAFLLEKLRKAPGFVPELSLVAVKNRVAVGHILFFPASIVSHNGTETSTLALALVSVHPLFQGQGIGRRLVAEGLSAARKQVCHSVAVCGHTHFYSRFGFRKASCYGIKPPFDWSDDAFMACELQPGALSSLSGTVCYHPAFAVLSLLAVEHPQCLFHKNI
ncbi:MAG: N-acetyltransferase [Dysgonamonadaceae bacterium]|nr:N-acetyltransferase [Dysgonamonadaceae bacterium]